MIAFHLLGQTIPKLVTDDGQATTIGVFILMLATAGLISLFGYNQWLASKVAKKQLNAPPVVPQPNPQPFEVTISKTLEEKFVMHRDFEGLEGKVDDHRKDALENIRKQSEIIRSLTDDAKVRGEDLAALKADSRTQTRQLKSIDENIGKLREDLGFQKGRTERK